MRTSRVHALATALRERSCWRNPSIFGSGRRRAGSRRRQSDGRRRCIASRVAPIDWSRPSREGRRLPSRPASRRSAPSGKMTKSVTVTVGARPDGTRSQTRSRLPRCRPCPCHSCSTGRFVLALAGLAAACASNHSPTGRRRKSCCDIRRAWWRQPGRRRGRLAATCRSAPSGNPPRSNRKPRCLTLLAGGAPSARLWAILDRGRGRKSRRAACAGWARVKGRARVRIVSAGRTIPGHAAATPCSRRPSIRRSARHRPWRGRLLFAGDPHQPRIPGLHERRGRERHSAAPAKSPTLNSMR